MNRFVILLHKLGEGVEGELGNEHWDMMFEVEIDGCRKLDTWAIPPQSNLIKTESGNIGKTLNAFSCPAKKLPYHRPEYLDYEGDISNNRGNVKKIDSGNFQKIRENKFNLSGNLINGELTITNNPNKPDSHKITFKPKINNF
ncbi:MAG: hypothetical protein LBT09_06315 [Planctomycetaceae bacterium]|jgi:hypothetical protein|nr:hypothetical protein [Planctomycetaceae bacterium]